MRNLLNSLALVLAASVLSVPAYAADWVFVAGHSTTTFYVDRTSIRSVGSHKQALERHDYPGRSYEFVRRILLVEYDCAGRRVRTLRATAYSRNGQNLNEPGHDWLGVARGTFGESLFDYVCFGRLS